MLTFEKVTTQESIKKTAELAKDIWNKYFITIITQSQIDYMIDKFQSEMSMSEQIKSGYEYYNFVLDGEIIGYFAICKKDDNTLFLSKLYLKKEYRGNGYARKAFEFIKELAKQKNCSMIWLTVNKRNDDSIAIYKKFGMEIIRSEVTDIGSGYVMDDYVFGYHLDK